MKIIKIKRANSLKWEVDLYNCEYINLKKAILKDILIYKNKICIIEVDIGLSGFYYICSHKLTGLLYNRKIEYKYEKN